MTREVARFMALEYSAYIRDCIKNGDKDFIKIDLDTNYSLYRAFYLKVMSETLNSELDTFDGMFDKRVVRKAVKHMKSILRKTGYSTVVANKRVAGAIFGVCDYVLERYEAEELCV